MRLQKSKIMNPFVTSGYVSPEYFCDRQKETEQLLRDIQGRSHTVIISPRRMGKTGLIQHCFHQDVISANFYHIFIDIYATLCLEDFIYVFGNELVRQLRSRNALDIFIRVVKSLKLNIGIDEKGFLSASFGIGDIQDANRTLDELFDYISNADKPCVIAVDEFQQISRYPEKNVEALLRTKIQHCNNATFLFAGSQRHLLQNMFASASKPFYHSANILSLKPIDKTSYSVFVREKFSQAGKNRSHRAERDKAKGVIRSVFIITDSGNADTERHNERNCHRSCRNSAGVKGHRQKICRAEYTKQKNQCIADQEQVPESDGKEHSDQSQHQKQSHSNAYRHDHDSKRYILDLIGKHLQIRF